MCTQGEIAAGSKQDLRRGVAIGLFLLFVSHVVIGTGLDGVSLFVDFQGFAMVAATVSGFLFMSQGFDGTLRVLRALTGHVPAEASDQHRIAAACASAAWTSGLSGVVATLIGVINMLACGMLDQSAWREGAAVALLTTLYGLLGAMLFLSMRARFV